MADDEPHINIRPRHEILGLEPGLKGYRRMCRCSECKAANAKKVRDWRRKREQQDHPERFVEVPTPGPGDQPQVFRIRDLPPGDVSTALAEELPALDGASPFQKTITAMMTKSALLLDNADALDRIDLINPMSLRIKDFMQLLTASRGDGAEGGPSPEDIAKMFGQPSAGGEA